MSTAISDNFVVPVATRPRPGKMLDEVSVFVWRYLSHIPRLPERLLDVTVQPIMFVLLFGYIFGSAVLLPGGGNYRAFLMAGIFVQTLAFQAITTAIGLVADMDAAVVDRFRALPIARASILIGRAIASLIEGFLGIAVMAACGLLVGWAPMNGPIETLAALGLLVFFAFAMISVGTFVGLVVRSVGTAQTFGFVLIFPLSFASNAFVPIDNMPGWLRVATDWNPVSALVAAVRELFGNPNPLPADAAWPLAHAVAASLIWCTALTVAGLGLAIWRYAGAERSR